MVGAAIPGVKPGTAAVVDCERAARGPPRIKLAEKAAENENLDKFFMFAWDKQPS